MSDENVPMAAWAPKKVWEAPEREFAKGEIVQHDGSNESALHIAAWLNAAQVSAFVVPLFGDFPAFIRVNAFSGSETITQEDYVFLSDNGRVEVLSWHKAKLRFRVENDETPIGRRTPHL